jgi:hypothetical protein
MKVEYPYRILLDYDFVLELAKGNTFNSREKFDVIHWLMYIKASSSTNSGDHNVMVDDIFNKVCTDKVMREDELRKIARPMSLPKELDIATSPVIRNLIAAITTTNNPPWSCIILTSKAKENSYKSKKVNKDLLDVQIQSGDNAYQTIKLMFSIYARAKH